MESPILPVTVLPTVIEPQNIEVAREGFIPLLELMDLKNSGIQPAVEDSKPTYINIQIPEHHNKKLLIGAGEFSSTFAEAIAGLSTETGPLILLNSIITPTKSGRIAAAPKHTFQLPK
jgi:hypothetical protein